MTDKEQWFWEQCGLSADKLPCLIIDCEEERSHALCKDCHVLYPPIDLNNLFKYAIPELKERLTEAKLGVLMVDWLQAVLYDGKDPADSLFELCYKAFGGKE